MGALASQGADHGSGCHTTESSSLSLTCGDQYCGPASVQYWAQFYAFSGTAILLRQLSILLNIPESLMANPC